MEKIIFLLHFSWLMGISSFIVLFDDIKECIGDLRFPKNKSKIKKSRKQYPDYDCRHYLFPNFQARHSSILYTFDYDLDILVNQVLDEEILNIYKDNYLSYFSSSYIFDYVIETPNYILTYWHHNLFYGMASNGSIRDKNGREIYNWNSEGISKKTRHRLYQIEESIRETYDGEEFPMLYNKDGVKAV